MKPKKPQNQTPQVFFLKKWAWVLKLLPTAAGALKKWPGLKNNTKGGLKTRPGDFKKQTQTILEKYPRSVNYQNHA
jgi:hypothetical protein